MRLLIVRHGDPDYEPDTVTQAGAKEADALAALMRREQIDHFYVSPMGRAKRTIAPTLEAMDREAQVLDWLEEFPAELDVNGNAFLQEVYPGTETNPDGTFGKRIVWDMLPHGWKNDPAYYGVDTLKDTPVGRNSDIVAVYRRVCRGLDALLEQHGYKREGMLYTTKMGNRKTLALFCHFGLSCVILSRLWNVSPFVLWHSLVMAPSSVTELHTEERVKGKVTFRASRIGDISHLYAAGLKPSFAARFCETFESDWEEH